MDFKRHTRQLEAYKKIWNYWNRWDDYMGNLYRGYVETKNKKCVEKFKDRTDFKTLEPVRPLPEYAGVLDKNAMFIDIDDPGQSEILMDIVEALQEAYNSFSAMMDECYAELSGKGEALYNQYSNEIAAYINGLQAKGDSDLAALTKQLIDFRNTNEARFLEWFDMVKGVFSTDAAGELLLRIESLNEQVAETQEMLFSGMARAELGTSQGDAITDSMGNPIMIGRPICRCAQ